MRRIGKALTLLAGLLLAVVVVVLSWPDSALREEARQALLASNAQVADGHNLFYAFAGFDAGPQVTDFVALGARRVRGVNARLAETDAAAQASGQPAEDIDFSDIWPRSRFDDGPLRELCDAQDRPCASYWRAQGEHIDALAQTYAVYLARYERLHSLAGHAMDMTADYRAPLPWFGTLMSIQRLRLNLLARQCAGNDRGALAGLRRDMALSRRTLLDPGHLLTQMAALERLRRALYVYAECLTINPAAAATAPELPALTEAEISLRDGYMIMYRESHRLLQQLTSNPESATGLKLPGWSVSRVLKLNRSSNMAYAVFGALARLSELPARDAVRAQAALTARLAVPWHEYLVNPVGAILQSVANPQTDGYVFRFHDVNGLIALVNAKRWLLHGEVPAERIAAALRDTPWRNPYDGSPLDWDGASATLGFSVPHPPSRSNRLAHTP